MEEIKKLLRYLEVELSLKNKIEYEGEFDVKTMEVLLYQFHVGVLL